MSEIRFLTSSDEHISDQTPGFRKDDYRAAILKKLEWQGRLAAKFNANAVLRGGDLFHVKAANKNTHATMSALSQIHRNYHCDTYSLSGNHDMSYNDISTIDKQPLGVLYKSGVFKKLDDVTFVDKSVKVRVVGVDYAPELSIEKIQNAVRKKDENFTVAVVHVLAAFAPSDKIQSFFNEEIFDYRDLVFNGCPDVYVFGHYHKDQGITVHEDVHFVNLGAISRGSLSIENVERKPKVSLLKFSSQGISVEEHVVPHEDASVVFDIERKEKIEKERKSFDDFIQKVKHSSVDTSADQDFRSYLSKFPDDLMKLGLEIMELAESGADID